MGKSLPHHRLAELATQYGPLMYLKLGETRNVVVSSPEVAREAAIIFYNARDIAFGAYGDYWRQMRKICTLELLSGHRVRLLRPVREEEISRLVKSIQRQSQLQPINLSRLLISLGNTITSRAAFGKVRKLEEAFLPVLNKIVKVLGGLSIGDIFPSNRLLRIVSGTERQVMKLHREADEILEGINDHEEDIVDVLLSFTENHDLGFPFTNVEIKVVILVKISRGSDSSSTTVEWAMSELMKNPSVMKKAQKEVRQVFDKRGHIVDEAGLDELHYLPLIIKETFRLHPTAPLLIPRECRETIVIDGYLIPAKTRVHINAWAIGRDPRHWTDPDEFIPERFIDSSVDYKGHDFQLIPFGAGRRVCPGMQYGLAVVELLLANLLYHFDWKLSDDEMKPRDLDMDEEFGAGVTRKNNLFLISVTYHGD
ncbi:Desmethyl-deoxy-podophyllotoxin synthase [Linum perenne]